MNLDNGGARNAVTLIGTACSAPVFSHISHDVTYMRFFISVLRLSGAGDTLPVLCDTAAAETLKVGSAVIIEGEMRSFNNRSGVGSRLVLDVLARSVRSVPEDTPHDNRIVLSGTVCRPPVYRETPLGREICDLLLAVPRQHERADYLPCIVWGRNARTCANLHAGTGITISGRFQSRAYTKIQDGAEQQKTAYEISCAGVEPLQ
jgi:single-stranded DNA-binding protein